MAAVIWCIVYFVAWEAESKPHGTSPIYPFYLVGSYSTGHISLCKYKTDIVWCLGLDRWANRAELSHSCIQRTGAIRIYALSFAGTAAGSYYNLIRQTITQVDVGIWVGHVFARIFHKSVWWSNRRDDSRAEWHNLAYIIARVGYYGMFASRTDNIQFYGCILFDEIAYHLAGFIGYAAAWSM